MINKIELYNLFYRFTYVDINVNDNYEKILSSDDFYYSKLLQLDVILRHFYQLSESIQRSLLFTVNASGMENHIKGEDLNTSILYCYFNCIDKCSADLIRHELPLSEEANEISTLDKTIITTLSLLPHYIHYSLFSFWEKHYFSMLIYYENQIIQTMLVESWCNIFKYLENNIQLNHISQLNQLLILLKDTTIQDSIKLLLYKLIRINIHIKNDNSIVKNLYSFSQSDDICSTEVEQKLCLLNMINMNDLYYRDEQTYKIALQIWENILCPLLEHSDERIALYAFNKCSLPIKAIQKYLDNNSILSLSSQEIKKLQDVSIVLLGNCKTAIQANLKESMEENEQMNAYSSFKTLESLIDISISLISEYAPGDVIKILEIIENWHFKVPYLKYELIPHVSIINFLSSCGQVDFSSKYINKATEL
ncbi:hypothetical protein BCR36DRAFT_56830, partial [Piromyces finnis]